MSGAPAPRWTAWRPGPRRFLATVCGLLFVGCVAALVAESTRRRAFAEDAGRNLAALPPAVLATAAILEDGDAAALIVAEGLLDAQAAPAAPPASAASTDAAREIVLATVGRRPASAHARLLLGQSAAAARPDLWKKPLGLASAGAPGLDRAAVALAQRYLIEWPALSAEDRPVAEAAIARAFFDETFLRSSFSLVLRRLGPDEAARLVPADARALETASRIATASGASRASELLAERRKSLGQAASSPSP
jgi:hypothetical protein